MSVPVSRVGESLNDRLTSSEMITLYHLAAGGSFYPVMDWRTFTLTAAPL